MAKTPATATGTRAEASESPKRKYEKAIRWNWSGPCIKGVC